MRKDYWRRTALADHACGLDTSDGCFWGMEDFEAKHRTGDALYKAVILFKDVVEIFLLPDGDQRPIWTRAITPRGTHTMFTGRKEELSINVPSPVAALS